MKVTICGIEVNEGVSKKTGNAYSMGSLHTICALAPPFGGKDNIAKGFMGTTYEADPVLLRKLEHLPFPLEAEVVIQNVMRFGKRQEVVADVVPVTHVKKAA